MEFLELAKKRYSCRSFAEKMVEKEKVDKILEVARIVPTAVNFQPQRILVLQDKNELDKLKGCTAYGWNAPLVMLVCYDKNVSWKRRFDNKDEGIVDASIVATHVLMEAYDLDLGGTWIGSFDPDKTKQIYNIPNNLEVVAILALGYPSEKSIPSDTHFKRMDIADMVYYDRIIN